MMLLVGKRGCWTSGAKEVCTIDCPRRTAGLLLYYSITIHSKLLLQKRMAIIRLVFGADSMITHKHRSSPICCTVQ